LEKLELKTNQDLLKLEMVLVIGIISYIPSHIKNIEYLILVQLVLQELQGHVDIEGQQVPLEQLVPLGPLEPLVPLGPLAPMVLQVV